MIKKCLYCGAEFTDNTSNHNKLFCSVPCRRSYLWYKNKKYRVKSKEYMRKWRKQNSERAKFHDIKRKDSKEVKARQLCYNHRRKYPELFPKECCICGITKGIEFHHVDYNFPLSVYPLCKKHHAELHRNLKNNTFTIS